MAYIYKTVLRRENHCFDICQNRWNSKETILLAMPRIGNLKVIHLGYVNNRTNEITISDQQTFKKSTIEELKKVLTNIFK